MTCPICDKKPMNCDCTPRERAMWRELHGDPAPSLTDAEREALWVAIAYAQNGGHAPVESALRGLLERLK